MIENRFEDLQIFSVGNSEEWNAVSALMLIRYRHSWGMNRRQFEARA